MITGSRITRPQAAVETLARNRLQILALFPPEASSDPEGIPGRFPRSATMAWLLERRVGLAMLAGTWLFRWRKHHHTGSLSPTRTSR